MKSPHDLTAELRALPEITAPPEIAATVLARIARIEPLPQATPSTGAARVRATLLDWLLFLLLGTGAAALTVGLFAAVNWITTARQASAMSGPAGLLDQLVPLAGMVLMCVLLYLGGLAVPIVRVRRPR
jgi:hypothetical protein